MGYYEHIRRDNRDRRRYGPVSRAIGWVMLFAVSGLLWVITLAPFLY